MQYSNDLKTQIRTFVAIALAVGVGVVGANVATASFNDVPAEGQFAESISRVQEAGIATGFPDGTFRPTTDLNRQQAADWIDRSAPRVGLDINNGGAATTLSSSLTTAVIGQIDMTSPAGAGTGWVTIQGGVGGVSTDPGTTCPCTVNIFVRDETDALVARSALTVASDPTGTAANVAPLFGIGSIDGGETHTYRLIVTLADPTQEVHVSGGLFLQYSPMVEGDPDSFPTESGGGPSAPVIDLVPQG